MTDQKIISEVRLIHGAKTLKAGARVTFDSAVGELTASGFAVIETEPGKPWVRFPQESYEKNGKYHNVSHLELAPRGKRAVIEAILAEYHRVAGTTATSVSSRPPKGLTP